MESAATRHLSINKQIHFAMTNKLLIFLLLVSLSFPLFADEIPVSSVIREVEVYRQGASIVEQGSVKVQKGDNLLVFSGLSQFLVANSVTVRGKGNGVIQLVKDRVSYLNRSVKPARMSVIEDSLARWELELQILADERFVLENEQALILKNNQLSSNEKGVTAEDLRQMADFYRNRLAVVRTQLRDISIKEKRVRQRTEAYRAEFQQIAAQRDQPTQEVIVAFQAEVAGTVELELSYMVSNTFWTPYYDVRVEKTNEPLKLFLKANVVNNTGVDWKQVKVRLSTNNNAAGSESPALSPWYVTVYQPRFEDMGYVSGRASAAAPAMSADSRAFSNTMDDVEEQKELTTMSDYTTTEEGELGLEFVIAMPYDIPADGQEHQVEIRTMDVPGEYRHFAVPKLDRDAFLVAYIRQDLLRGKANVYFEGTFVGETFINTDNPRDSMKISLGRDPKVQIQREQISDFTSEKQLGSNIRKAYGYEITVRNNKTTPVSLSLEDQIPVSQNKDITVELLDAGGGSVDANTGKVVWALDLKPGETRKLVLKFEVKYPKDQPVSGL
ncbi:MAG: mucoidy inhibitor MuiA family protein [Bacteroidetes bacterium]|nr:MAG: mucoidy inhibitor MuiA family protein [Bacteroidota bacterium]